MLILILSEASAVFDAKIEKTNKSVISQSGHKKPTRVY